MTTIQEAKTIQELQEIIDYIDEIITGNLTWASHVGTEPEVDDLYEEIRQAESKMALLRAKQNNKILATLNK